MATKEEAIDLVFKKYRDIKRIYFDKMENRMKDSILEGYNAGFNDGCAAKSEELKKGRAESYQQGFEEGKKTANIVSETVSLDQKAYDAGLAVAWGVAATLATEYSINDVKEIFDISDYDEIYNLKVQDVIQKLYDYKSAKDKNVLTNKEKLLEIFGDNGLDFAAWWDNLWLEAEYKEPKT